MNKIAVVMASDDNQAFALANVIIGLKRYNEFLIDKIYIYHDIHEHMRKKIYNIWPDVIEFIDYKYEDFLLDVGRDVSNLLIGKKYGHFIFSKYHLFDYIYDFTGVLWLDCDILITGNIDSLFQGENDVLWRYGDKSFAYKYFNTIGISCALEDVIKPNGGVILIKNSIITKIGYNKNITKECFDILLDLFDKKIITTVAQADEIPFAVLQKKYGLITKDSKGIANVFPEEADKNTLIIHTPLDLKFWQNPCTFFIFQEWYVNYKLLINKYSFKDDSIILSESIYNSYGDCYKKLLYSYMFDKIFKDMFLFLNDTITNFYLRQNYNFIDIIFKNNEKIFYRISINTWAPIRHCSYEIKLICKDFNLINNFNNIFNDLNEYILYKNDKIFYLREKVKFDNILLIKKFKIFILNTYKKISEYVNKIQYLNINNLNKLMSYHKTLLCYNSLEQRILLSNNSKNYIYIEYKNKFILLFVIINEKKYYIQSISRNGYINLSTNNKEFTYEIINNKISIKLYNMFLSARKDSTVSFVKKCKDWELFYIIK